MDGATQISISEFEASRWHNSRVCVLCFQVCNFQSRLLQIPILPHPGQIREFSANKDGSCVHDINLLESRLISMDGATQISISEFDARWHNSRVCVWYFRAANSNSAYWPTTSSR